MQMNFGRFWEVLLRPDVLFPLVVLQALSPYIFWQYGVGRAIPSSSLNYITAGIWLVGCCCFWFGCFLVRRRIKKQVQFVLAPRRKRIALLLWCLIAIGVAEAALTVRVYGTLPILSYVREDDQINVGEATELQEQSGLGQIASLNLTVNVIGGVLLEMAIVAIEEKKKVPLSFYCGLITALAIGLVNGKRIDMFRLFAFMICGLCLYSRNSIQNVSVVVPFFKKRVFVYGTMLLIASALFISFGLLSQLRNQHDEKRSSMEEAILYQEGPILNMELQTLVAGPGPYAFQPLVPFQQIVPSKWIPALGLYGSHPQPKEDITAPSGFYELLQWNWGPAGIILFSIATGSLCMWFYSRSRDNIWSLLCYSQLFFSILLAHSFNEFLQAPVSVVPCALLWFLGKWTNSKVAVVEQEPLGADTLHASPA